MSTFIFTHVYYTRTVYYIPGVFLRIMREKKNNAFWDSAHPKITCTVSIPLCKPIGTAALQLASNLITCN